MGTCQSNEAYWSQSNWQPKVPSGSQALQDVDQHPSTSKPSNCSQRKWKSADDDEQPTHQRQWRASEAAPIRQTVHLDLGPAKAAKEVVEKKQPDPKPPPPALWATPVFKHPPSPLKPPPSMKAKVKDELPQPTHGDRISSDEPCRDGIREQQIANTYHLYNS